MTNQEGVDGKEDREGEYKRRSGFGSRWALGMCNVIGAGRVAADPLAVAQCAASFLISVIRASKHQITKNGRSQNQYSNSFRYPLFSPVNYIDFATCYTCNQSSPHTLYFQQSSTVFNHCCLLQTHYIRYDTVPCVCENKNLQVASSLKVR